MSKTETQKPAKPVLVTVAGTVTPVVKEAIEDYRWTARQNVSQFVTQAVQEKVSELGLDLDAAQARLDARAAEAAAAKS